MSASRHDTSTTLVHIDEKSVHDLLCAPAFVRIGGWTRTSMTGTHTVRVAGGATRSFGASQRAPTPSLSRRRCTPAALITLFPGQDVRVACMCARKQSHRVAEMYPSLTGLWAELSQIACYGCLDVITKVVFGYILMSSHAVIDKVHDTEESECAPAACQGLVAWMGRVLPGWGCCRWGCPPGTVCDRCSPVFPCPHHERARACAGAGGSPT